MGTCPPYQPWLCSTMHWWPASLLSHSLQDRPDAGSGLNRKKAGLSAVS